MLLRRLRSALAAAPARYSVIICVFLTHWCARAEPSVAAAAAASGSLSGLQVLAPHLLACDDLSWPAWQYVSG